MEKPDRGQRVAEKYARTGHRSIDELVAEQGTRFRADPAELLGDFWPEEESIENFLRARHYNKDVMQTITVESIPIVVGREEDGRWWADIEVMPGVMTYGTTREAAIASVRALALRVAADCIEHPEEFPEQLARIFSVA